MIVEFRTIINFIHSSWFKILYKKYIYPLYDVKHAKKPLNIIISLKEPNFFAEKKPTKNDPIIEIIKLLFSNNLKEVAK